MADLETAAKTKSTFAEGAAPGTPSAATVIAYAKADGLMYSKDDAGTETLMSSGASLSNPMTTAGDIIKGGAAGIAERLAIGAAETMLRSNGTAPAWAVPSQVLIASEVKGSAGASFQFAGIAGTYNSLRVILAGRCSAAVFDSYVRVQFNADTAGNYDYKLFVDTGAATAGTLEQFAQTSAIVGQVPGASGPASIPGILTIDIPLYAGTTFQKSGLFASGEVGQSTGNLRQGMGVFNWRNTAAITQIDLILGTGTNFVIGSAAYLYGIT